MDIALTFKIYPMKTIIISILILVVCGQSAYAHRITKPTIIDFGDSVSKQGYAGPARLYLWPAVDFRHDAWKNENIVPSDTPEYYQEASDQAINDWDSYQTLAHMGAALNIQFYTMVVFNSGVHDQAEGVSLRDYRRNIDEMATLANRHGKYCLWVDSAPDGALPDGSDVIDPYNEIGREVSIKHGCYVLSPVYPGEIQPGIHYPLSVYKELGHEVADKIKSILVQ